MMLSFSRDCGVFSVRAVGVLLHGARVLLHRAEHDPFWVLPGGRVEFNEDTAAAVVREFKEELLVDVQVERLLWVVENFFEYNGARCHGMELYFLLSLPPESDLSQRTEPWTGREENCTLIFNWFPVQELERMDMYPVFLKRALCDVPQTVVHVVQRDE